jgi:lipopolysaccharide export system permease protein
MEIDPLPWRQTHHPIAATLHCRKGTGHVGYPADPNLGCRSRGGGLDRRRDRDGAVLGDDHPPEAAGQTGAQHGTEILRILHLVDAENDPGLLAQHLVERGVGKRPGLSHNAVMVPRSGQRRQPGLVSRLDRYSSRRGQLSYRRHTPDRPAVEEHANHVRRTYSQPCRHGVDTIDIAFATALSVYKAPPFHYDSSRPVPTINRYILREITVPFLLGLAVFTLVLLVARILKLVEMVVNRGVPLGDVLLLFAYILPGFLEVTVPMAVLLAVLVAFGRLSSDSEITALKTSGVSLYQLLRPVVVFALLIYVVSLGISMYARPWGNALLRNTLYEIAKTRASAGIKEKVFADEFPGLVIYVDRIEPPGNTLRGVLIADARDVSQRNTVFAKAGLLIPNERLHTLTLRLVDGSVHAFYPRERSYHRTDFTTYDISLDLNAALAKIEPRTRQPSELPLGELRGVIATKRAAGESTRMEDVELQRRFSIPFACLGFAAIAIPLGIRPSLAVRSRGFTVSLVLIFAYYLLLTLGENLGQRGTLPPWLALWLPNIFLTALAVVVFVRAAEERGTWRSERLEALAQALRTRVAAFGSTKGL